MIGREQYLRKNGKTRVEYLFVAEENREEEKPNRKWGDENEYVQHLHAFCKFKAVF